MNNNNILIVCAQAVENSTSSMIRILSLANALAEMNYSIDFVTVYPDTGSIYHNKIRAINNRINVFRIGKKRIVIESKAPESVSLRSLLIANMRKIYKKFDLFGASIKHYFDVKDIDSSILNKKYEYLISFSGPLISHIIANEMIKKMEYKPYYIQQWGDPLTLNMADQSVIPSIFKRFVEYKMLKHSDKICYVSPLTLVDQKKVFKKLKKKMSFTPTPSQFHDLEHIMNSNSGLRMCYFGSYKGIARNILPLYEVVNSLDDTSLLIVGDSDIKLKHSPNTTIKERVTSQETRNLMKECDVLVCIMNISGNQIPGKIFHYSGTTKDILVVLDGENGKKIKQYFSRFNRYTFCENNNVSILTAIKKYHEIGVPIREPLGDFSPERVAVKLLKKL